MRGMLSIRGMLTIVGTPIGNLGDMSPRAVEALRDCDFIAAEDTRVTMRLLNHFDIKKPMVSYFEHNKRERGEQICDRIDGGENAVLVTDAGMPAISDPGQELVALCRERDIHVVAVPGPTAAMTALALSGLPCGRFTFEGFISMNKRSRKEHLTSLKNEQRTMIFYEAPHKLLYTLVSMLEFLGDRRIVLARELTKIHEETIEITLAEAIAKYTADSPRGEFVIIVEGAESPAVESVTVDQAADIARDLVSTGVSVSEAARVTAAETGIKKSEIYRLICR